MSVENLINAIKDQGRRETAIFGLQAIASEGEGCFPDVNPPVDSETLQALESMQIIEKVGMVEKKVRYRFRGTAQVRTEIASLVHRARKKREYR